MTTMPAFVLTHMSWPEVRSALETVRLAIIPTGSCEQHGPNMTLETDAAICYALAERLAQRLYPRALLAPLLPWGVSPHHMNFPGTITHLGISPKLSACRLTMKGGALEQRAITEYAEQPFSRWSKSHPQMARTGSHEQL